MLTTATVCLTAFVVTGCWLTVWLLRDERSAWARVTAHAAAFIAGVGVVAGYLVCVRINQ